MRGRAPLSPHPPLPTYYHDSSERQQFVSDLFNRTAPHYEWIVSAMSLGSGALYRRQALERAGLAPGMKVLDIASGTGLVARAAAEITGNPRGVVGLDPSRGMLLEAQRRKRLPLVQSYGESLPFASESFDFLSQGYGLRHLPDLEQAFREYHRVLRPGGRLLILEMSRPQGRIGLALARFYFGTVVPLVARLGTGSADAGTLMKYYWQTVNACVPPEVILGALSSTGFRRAERGVQLGIFSEYLALK